MINVAISYDPQKQTYGVYEDTTDTFMVSTNLTEALVNLENFLIEKLGIKLLSTNDVTYHLDSQTMISIVEGNVNLLKRLSTAPSSFMMSSQKFGGGSVKGDKKQQGDYKKTRSGAFQSATGFKQSYKKFGGK